MQAPVLDRRAQGAGGLPVVSDPEMERVTAEALLVLADGSVWRGWTARSTSSAVGAVSVVGDVALVGTSGAVFGLCTASLREHLGRVGPAGQGTGIRGCLTASGATTPLHATVALAVVRGEIGRP